MRNALKTIYFISLPLMGILIFAGFLNLFWAVFIAYAGAVLLFISSLSLKKTAFVVLGVVLTLSSILLHWPFGYLLPMSGHVKDKKTGKPIENAIFEVEWLYGYATVGGAVREVLDKTYVVSGKDGRYRIDGRIMVPFPLGSYGVHQSITLRYPLYRSKTCSMQECAENLVVLTDEDSWKEKNQYYVDRKPRFRPRFGRTKRDFEMTLIEEIYKNIKDREDSAYADRDLSEVSKYADLAIQLKLAHNIKWDEIFNNCNRFVSKWPDSHIKEDAFDGLRYTRRKLFGEGNDAK